MLHLLTLILGWPHHLSVPPPPRGPAVGNYVGLGHGVLLPDCSYTDPLHDARERYGAWRHPDTRVAVQIPSTSLGLRGLETAVASMATPWSVQESCRYAAAARCFSRCWGRCSLDSSAVGVVQRLEGGPQCASSAAPLGPGSTNRHEREPLGVLAQGDRGQSMGLPRRRAGVRHAPLRYPACRLTARRVALSAAAPPECRPSDVRCCVSSMPSCIHS